MHDARYKMHGAEVQDTGCQTGVLNKTMYREIKTRNSKFEARDKFK